MVYETLLILGALGMLAQAAHSHSSDGQRVEGPSPLWALLSPLAFFSLWVGAGATGLLTHAFLHGFWSALEETSEALLFYGLLICPMWNFAMRFVSEPSKALEGVVATTAEALSRFDARGQDMVRVTIDGQIVRLPANLEPVDRNSNVAVSPGEKLLVTSVDGHSNTCRVTRL